MELIIKLIVKLDVAILLLYVVLTSIAIVKNDKIIGFALDGEGKLYIGKNSVIEVYDNGTLEKTIRPVTNRGYQFTIRDERILIYTGTKIYYLDFNGNVIDSEAFNGIATKEVRELGKVFEDSEGNHYRLKRPFGRLQIIENDSRIIFQEPTGAYVFHCALFLVRLLFIMLSLSVLVISIQNKKK